MAAFALSRNCGGYYLNVIQCNMAAKSSYFDVPEWEGNDSCTEHLAQAVFQSIPPSSKIKGKKYHKTGCKEILGESISKPSQTDSLWTKEYDDYLNSLDPGDRMSVLFSKLQKNGGKNTYADDGTKDKNLRKGKKRKQIKAQHNDLTCDVETSREEMSRSGEEDITYAFDKHKAKHALEKKRKRAKRRVKLSDTVEPENGTAKADDAEVLEIQKDCSQKVDDNSEKINVDESRKSVIRTEKGDRNGWSDFDSGPSERSGSSNISGPSTKLKEARARRNIEKTRGDKTDHTTIHQNARDSETELKTGGRVELHSASINKNKVNVDFRTKLQKRLNGAQFRWINEQLYTVSSDRALDMFSNNPSLFDIYHRGFQSQVKLWPQNPIDMMIADLKKRYGIFHSLTGFLKFSIKFFQFKPFVYLAGKPNIALQIC